MAAYNANRAEADNPREKPPSLSEGRAANSGGVFNSQGDVEGRNATFGIGQHEAEAELYAYMDRMQAGRRSGFAPFDELSSRLGEFTAPSEHKAVFDDAEAADTPHTEITGVSKQWLAQQFAGLQARLSRHEAGFNHIRVLNERIETLGDRMMQLPLATRNLEAERISRAAKEIMLAAGHIEGARRDFQTATASTSTFKDSVKAAAMEVASLTAARVETAIAAAMPQGGLSAMEKELRALNSHSREASERNAQALDRMHDTLRQFLERKVKAPVRATTQQLKTRTPIQTPIGAPPSSFSQTPRHKPSAPAQKPLETLTERRPAPLTEGIVPPPHSPQAAEHAPRFLREGRVETPVPAPLKAEAIVRRAFHRDDSWTFPVIGLSIVALMMVMASVALYYLHTRSSAQSRRGLQPSVTSQTTPQGQPGTGSTLSLTLAKDKADKIPPLLIVDKPLQTETKAVRDDALDDLKALTVQASLGDAGAQFQMGSRLINSGADATAAIRWLSRAADQGHTEAQFLLGSVLERGVGAAKDERQSIGLYRKAATSGHVQSMHNLGVLLHRLAGRQADREAAKWFASAASTGLAASQYNLAMFYERGLGVPADKTRSFFWYRVAEAGGDAEAKVQADRLQRLLSPAIVKSATEDAASWRPLDRKQP